MVELSVCVCARARLQHDLTAARLSFDEFKRELADYLAATGRDGMLLTCVCILNLALSVSCVFEEHERVRACGCSCATTAGRRGEG